MKTKTITLPDEYCYNNDMDIYCHFSEHPWCILYHKKYTRSKNMDFHFILTLDCQMHGISS